MEWRASPGAAGRGCTLEVEAFDMIVLSPLFPMVACNLGSYSSGLVFTAQARTCLVGRRQAGKLWSGGRHRVQRGGAAL